MRARACVLMYACVRMHACVMNMMVCLRVCRMMGGVVSLFRVHSYGCRPAVFRWFGWMLVGCVPL